MRRPGQEVTSKWHTFSCILSEEDGATGNCVLVNVMGGNSSMKEMGNLNRSCPTQSLPDFLGIHDHII